MSDCTVPEEPLKVKYEEDLIYSEYSAGSIVWAKMQGWPWWPAMVDDCPDAEQFYWLDGFSDIPTHYNVTFFDACEVTRAWILPKNLKPYKGNTKFRRMNNIDNCRYRLEAAIKQADDAVKLDLINRLTTYSFIARYKYAINTPKKVKKTALKKYQNEFKKKYNLNLCDESSEDSDSSVARNNAETKLNVITVGSNKRNNSAVLDKKVPNKLSKIVKEIIGKDNNVEESGKCDTRDEPNASELSNNVDTEEYSDNTNATSALNTEILYEKKNTDPREMVPSPGSADFEF